MIERFDVIGSTDFVDRVDGPYVTYNDHAAEMREVLAYLRKYYTNEGRMLLDKYAHYLEEK